MIAIVAMVVAIGLIIFYSSNIRDFLNSIMHGNEEWGAEKIESANFATSQLRTYIIACWDRYEKKYTQNKICYVLLGSVSNVDSAALVNSLDPPASVDISKFDKSKNTTIIKTMSNGIMVESS